MFPCSLVFLLLAQAICSHAADQTFVGVLALATETEVADELGLSSTQREKLLSLVDDREDAALELALEIRDLSREEQGKRFAPFRAETETMGLKLLSPSQRESLEAIRIRSLGLEALTEPTLSERLNLDDEQNKAFAILIEARTAALANAGSAKGRAVRLEYERQLQAVLNADQLAEWNSVTSPVPIAGGGTAAGQTAQLAGDQRGNKRAMAKKRAKSIGTSLDGNKKTGNDAGSQQKLQFAFRFAPWRDVIEWFAEQADLSLLLDAPPQGTFNYTDPREYTPAQAIDLLNSVLLTKGYTLVRREKMLMVINLEDGIPPNLITEVSADDLDKLGEYELVRCLFTLERAKAEEAEAEISRLIGPQGKVDLLASSNQLLITETAGRLRTFKKILAASDRNNDSALGEATMLPLQYARAKDVVRSWQKLMGLSDEETSTPDGGLRIAVKSSRQLLVTGQPHRIKEFEDLARLLDKPTVGSGPLDVPQLEVYPIVEADPVSVLQVMETLLEDADDVRLAMDESNRSLVALARPADHATIRATLDQMQRDRRSVEVIRLRTVDPQLAMMSIDKLFGTPEGAEESDPNAPRIDADPTTRSLLIRASRLQIEEIRSLLAKMGEDDSQDDGPSGRSLSSGRGKLRMIPIDAATARRALEQMNSIWPNVRSNRIRTVTPSSSIRGLRPGKDVSPDEAVDEVGRETVDLRSENEREQRPNSTDIRSQRVQSISRYVVNDTAAVTDTSEDADDAGSSNDLQAGDLAVLNNATEELPDVVVTIGDQGLLIASEDVDALDEFEQVFRTLTDQLFTGSRELTVFYLKYAKAEVAAELLKQFISGSGGGSAEGSSGGTLLGSLAGAALGGGGGGGGGLIGNLLGLGGGGGGGSATISGGTSIIADSRLNALVVQATPKELDFIEQLLRVVDRASSPEAIETVPAPQAIPVINADAMEIAEIVRSVYATRLAGQGRAPKQPSPEEFIRAMSGQKNSSRNMQDAISDQVRLSVSVDERRNALIVVAPDWLFQEVKALVGQLDFEMPETTETIRYGHVASSSPESIRDAIQALISDEQQAQATSEPTKRAKKEAAKASQSSMQPRTSPDEIKRRMEFFKAMQKSQEKRNKAPKKKLDANRTRK